jgi:hypothetical protein
VPLNRGELRRTVGGEETVDTAEYDHGRDEGGRHGRDGVRRRDPESYREEKEAVAEPVAQDPLG